MNRLLAPDHKLIDHERDTFSILIRQGITTLYILENRLTTARNFNLERLASSAYPANEQKT